MNYLYDDSAGITYAKHPSNLVQPLKVNEFKSYYDPWQLKSLAFDQTAKELPGGPAELADQVKSMKPLLFNPETAKEP